MPEQKQEKRIALITGGSRGIGLGIARQLATDGFDLAINGVRDALEVDEALKALEALGARVIYCQGNIAATADRTKMITMIQERYGALHVLVNNAGVAPKERRDILEATEESFDYVMSTNLKGTYFLTQSAANWMIAQKQTDPHFQGCIINISSISSTIASVNRGEYCLSKAALSMSTQLFATRLGAFDIPVYEIRPGIIATDMTAGVQEKYEKLIADGLTVQKRWGYPEDVGKAAGALASGQFPYSTGQVIFVDGGLTLSRL